MPPESAGGESTYFFAVNRNKRSVVLDLTDPGDAALARELATRADVLIDNFKPGTLERFGLGPELLAADNPRLVHCSITGFGTGPGASMPGYDPLVQALSGLMSITGPADGEASKVGVALVDVIAGQGAAVAVLAALAARERGGAGQRIEIDLLSSALSALVNQASGYLNAGAVPQRLGNVHPSIEPFATYAAADGALMICAGNDRQFAALCEALGAPELVGDERFATNPSRVANRAGPAAAARAAACDSIRGAVVGAPARGGRTRRAGQRSRRRVRARRRARARPDRRARRRADRELATRPAGHPAHHSPPPTAARRARGRDPCLARRQRLGAGLESAADERIQAGRSEAALSRARAGGARALARA